MERPYKETMGKLGKKKQQAGMLIIYLYLNVFKVMVNYRYLDFSLLLSFYYNYCAHNIILYTCKHVYMYMYLYYMYFQLARD